MQHDDVCFPTHQHTWYLRTWVRVLMFAMDHCPSCALRIVERIAIATTPADY
jgi:hypothetical protein